MTTDHRPGRRPRRRRSAPARPASSPTSSPSPGGRCAASRATSKRVIPRDRSSPLFFFIVNIAHAVEPHRDEHPRASTSRRSSCRPRSCSASPACPGRRPSCSTSRTATSTACCSAGAPQLDPARAHGRRRRRGDRADHPDHRPSASLVGVRFDTGRARRRSPSSSLGALWSLAFTGFGYAIALKTGNPAAVNSCFLLFFPFLFLTTSYVPARAARRLARRRGRVEPGDVPAGGHAVADLRRLGLERSRRRRCSPMAIVGVVSMSLCFAALRGRIKRGGT